MNTKNFLLIILLLLPSIAPAKYDPTTRSRLMQKAGQEYQLGNYDAARKIYSDIYVEDGDKASKELMNKCTQCLTLISDALMAERNGQFATAIEKYQAVMKLNSRDLKVLKLLKECENNNNTVNRYSSGRDFVETAAGLNMKMVWVEGGEFMMGGTSEQGSDAESDEQVIRRVKLNSYYIGECEITQAQWEKVMGTSIEQQADKVGYPTYTGTGHDYPMYYVSWEEAQAFCLELSRLTGRTYCLPTEAQWEYAARGGKNADGTKYSGSWSIDAVAWYNANSGNSTHPVKNKRANNLGLYDMSGNVYEWCSDWYGDYNKNDTTNPTGPSSGSYRIVRGGGLCYVAQRCRVSSRNYFSPGSRVCIAGFRVVVLPDRSSSGPRGKAM